MVEANGKLKNKIQHSLVIITISDWSAGRFSLA
jgi:hypothetical protein